MNFPRRQGTTAKFKTANRADKAILKTHSAELTVVHHGKPMGFLLGHHIPYGLVLSRPQLFIAYQFIVMPHDCLLQFRRPQKASYMVHSHENE